MASRLKMAPEDPQNTKRLYSGFSFFQLLYVYGGIWDPQAERTPGNTVLGVKKS